MRATHVYLLLCVVGTVLPLSQFLPWLAAQPLDAAIFERFIAELFSTAIGGFFGMDVIASAATLFVFIFVERRRLGLRHTGWLVAATLTVGVSLGLPLLLFMRQRALDRRSEIQPA